MSATYALPELAPGEVWLIAAGRAPEEPLALVAAAGTPEQRRIVTRLGDAAEAAGRLPRHLPLLVVLGEVVDLAAILAPDAPAAEPAGEPLRLSS